MRSFRGNVRFLHVRICIGSAGEFFKRSCTEFLEVRYRCALRKIMGRLSGWKYKILNSFEA